MKLKAVLGTLEGVDESLHGFYTKGSDEKYYLDLDGVDDHPSVLPVIRKKNELLTEVKDLKTAVRKFEGIEDPEAARTALQRVTELEEQLAGGGGKNAEAIAKLQRDHQAAMEALRRQSAQQLEERDTQLQRERTAAEDFFVRSEIARAFGAARGNPEALDYITYNVRQRVKPVRREDGTFERLAVLDAQNVERVKDSKLTPATIDDFVLELREDPKYGTSFSGSGQSGSGADPLAGAGGNGGGKVVKAEGGVIRVDPAKVVSGEVKVARAS